MRGALRAAGALGAAVSASYVVAREARKSTDSSSLTSRSYLVRKYAITRSLKGVENVNSEFVGGNEESTESGLKPYNLCSPIEGLALPPSTALGDNGLSIFLSEQCASPLLY